MISYLTLHNKLCPSISEINQFQHHTNHNNLQVTPKKYWSVDRESHDGCVVERLTLIYEILQHNPFVYNFVYMIVDGAMMALVFC